MESLVFPDIVLHSGYMSVMTSKTMLPSSPLQLGRAREAGSEVILRQAGGASRLGGSEKSSQQHWSPVRISDPAPRRFDASEASSNVLPRVFLLLEIGPGAYHSIEMAYEECRTEFSYVSRPSPTYGVD